jgi:hypothetical protein
MVASAGLEKPDAHAQSRRDLPHALLQHQGCRAHGAGDSARGRRCDQRHHHGRLAGATGGCRSGRRRQRQGREIPDPAAGLTRTRYRTATSLSRRRITRATRCCAPFSEAAAIPTSPRPSTTPSASDSIPFHRRRIHRRQHSSTRSTSFTTPPFRTTCVSSSRSIAWCRWSRGSRATS